MEALVREIVATMAKERGVSVTAVRLTLAVTEGRVAAFQVACDVRAMIVSATLTVRGVAVIGDDLTARFEELVLTGEGMIAGIARTALEPHLAKLRQEAFPIANVKLPGLRVVDVQLAAGDLVRLTVALAPAD